MSRPLRLSRSGISTSTRKFCDYDFVKRTVNFDDPRTYHFYFGNDAGSPGMMLTFFPWPRAASGQPVAGEVIKTAFSVPWSSLHYNISVERAQKRFDEELLTFADPDGMKIEIVGHADAGEVNAPRFATVLSEHAIRGFFGVALCEQRRDDTVQILGAMGFKNIAEQGNRFRFCCRRKALGNHVDLLIDPDASYGDLGAGSVHHIAFRAKDDPAQGEWRQEIAKDLAATPIKDRTYFHSIYFREPAACSSKSLPIRV